MSRFESVCNFLDKITVWCLETFFYDEWHRKMDKLQRELYDSLDKQKLAQEEKKKARVCVTSKDIENVRDWL